MRRIKLTFIFLLVCYTLTVLLSGCAKDNLRQQSCSGTVTNLTTGEAAQGAKINLVEEHISSEPFGPINRTVLQSVETDALGYFEFVPIEKVRRNRNYYVQIADDWNYAIHGWQGGTYEEVIAEIPLGDNSLTDIELKLVPQGSFDLVAEVSSMDSVYVEGLMTNGKLEVPLLGFTFHGGQNYAVSNITMPSDTYEVTWTIIKNDSIQTLYQQFDLPFAEHVVFNFVTD